MEVVKYIILGVLFGVGGMYLFQDTQTLPSSPIVEGIEKECLEKKETELKNRESSFFSKSIKEVQKIAQNQKRIKTPDELYEEQQKEKEETQESYEEDKSHVVDRRVISIELEQVEAQAESFFASNIGIDRNIISEEMEEAEAITDEEIVSEDDIPPFEPEIHDEEIEIKDVISEELRDLEEYGDPYGIPEETEITK